jgi:hypothetical protein
MKRAFFSVVLAWTVVQTFGQGTIVLNNRVPGVVVTHVWFGCPWLSGNSPLDYPPGTTSYDGFVLTGAPGSPSASTTMATLLGAPGANASENSLVPSASAPTSFRTAAAGWGTVVPTTDVFPGIPPGVSVGTFQMVVWDNSSGLYPTWTQASAAWLSGLITAGKSPTFVLTNLGGFEPTYLVGLQSFAWGYLECPPQILQQPTNHAAVVGGQAILNVVARTWEGATNFQWYFNNAPIPGETHQTLVRNNVQPSDFGPYFVTVNNGIAFPFYYRTSAIANITLALSPALANFRVDSNAKFSFVTELGPNYVVEYKSGLTDPAWIPQSTNPGTGGVVDVTDPAVGIASRFYRVRLY